MIEFDKALFIRLGQKNQWAEECIDKGKLMLGFNSPYHIECLKHNWSVIQKFWENEGKSKGKAKDYTNQIKKFYTADSKVLWVTFYKRKLYYCFSEPKIVEEGKGGNRVRTTITGWSYLDNENKELSFDRLSTKLTKTQGYQGTICEIREIDYLKNKINCNCSEITQIAKSKKNELIKSIIPLISELNWYDFELLVDLIFTYSGWKRIETLGRNQSSIDLDLELPINNKRAFVQVKSRSTFKEYIEYKEEFENMSQYDEFFYFVSKGDKKLIELAAVENNHIFTGYRLAQLVIKSGLIDWIIEKTN